VTGMETTTERPDQYDFVTPGRTRLPDRALLRWIVHQRLRHRDRLLWRRWRLGYELTRRGVHYRQPLQGNILQLLLEGRLSLGERCYLEASMTIRANEGGRIVIGSGAEFNRNVTIGSGHLVVVGDHVLVGQGSYITDVNHVYADPETPVEDQGFSTRGPTIIEDNVWIGANVVVASGVRVGRGSVIGAGAVLTRSVPAYSLVRGAPPTVAPRHDLVREAVAARP
jgi:acetyltransferase-like isoleucine patch superfamily enzyme